MPLNAPRHDDTSRQGSYDETGVPEACLCKQTWMARRKGGYGNQSRDLKLLNLKLKRNNFSHDVNQTWWLTAWKHPQVGRYECELMALIELILGPIKLGRNGEPDQYRGGKRGIECPGEEVKLFRVTG